MRRLILFDIDGTLVWGGPAKEAFCQAMLDTYGTTGDLRSVSFAGKTDPQIARELLAGAGIDPAAIADGFESLWTRYVAHLGERIVRHPVEVLPGVHDLIDALDAFRDVGLGLLTGNIAGGAELKLGSAGLWGRFGFGSYGSDHEERDELPAIAVARARELWGDALSAEHAVIVGDTPRDVQCGRAGGMRTIAVATGSYTAADLHRTGADHVLPDFSRTTEVVELLVG
jgi:phosphoglycolate phosphatase-like HAD superfamily hydrolase